MSENILKALAFNEFAYNSVKERFERGMSEKDIKNIILSACSSADDFSGDIVSGIRTSEIEGDATSYILTDGDCLILDLQFKTNGVWSDTTRTFFVGEPSEEMRRAYNLCCSAKKAGERLLKSGAYACDIYNAVKMAFTPFGENFPHHAGHLCGEERVMQPQFLPEKLERLNVDVFVTLEPGIYFEGCFGVRIEDNYRITEDGFENLFDYPLKLEDNII